MNILKTPQAADALGCSVSYLKRQRDTHGGFLELGKHYHRKPSSNAAITWDVDLIRAEMNKRSRRSLLIHSAVASAAQLTFMF